MIDIHLINMALAGVGIAAGAAILLAVLIIVIAGIRQHRIGERADRLAAARTAVLARTARTAATSAASPAGHQAAGHEPTRELREPALR
jgi:hypothetical protein